MNKGQRIFITGIGTDIGKTLAATILVEALHADYWKPVQAGSLNDTDSDFVQRMISNEVSVIHPESFRLTEPMSPHAAAKIDGVKIRLRDFHLPHTNNTLIIEGAGGILVPLNEKLLVIDLIEKLDADVIIVIRNYLGSINHSLLTIEAAKSRKLKIAGLIINGEPNKASEEIILRHSNLPLLGRIFTETEITQAIISKYSEQFEFFK
ncbi:MAG: dethiobiotin synthase [Chitinophagales bacterium]